MMDFLGYMDEPVTCKFCGREEKYGNMTMNSGYSGCRECYWDDKAGLHKIVPFLKQHNYGAYLSGNFYDRGFEWCKENIDQIKWWD